MHFLVSGGLVKDIFSPIFLDTYRLSNPRIGMSPRLGYTRWLPQFWYMTPPIRERGATDSLTNHLVSDLVILSTENFSRRNRHAWSWSTSPMYILLTAF